MTKVWTKYVDAEGDDRIRKYCYGDRQGNGVSREDLVGAVDALSEAVLLQWRVMKDSFRARFGRGGVRSDVTHNGTGYGGLKSAVPTAISLLLDREDSKEALKSAALSVILDVTKAGSAGVQVRWGMTDVVAWWSLRENADATVDIVRNP